MLGTFNALFAATVLFVGGHFLLSSQALRRPLIERLGARGFRGLYALVVTIAFVWMLVSYNRAPIEMVWQPPGWANWIPLLLMPISFILAVAGLTTKSPTMVGWENVSAERDFAPGILRITRHPFLWGTTLWAVSHLLVNGDLASIILMGGILVLSLGGMHHIDLRRATEMGSSWGPIALTTSRLPFAAIIEKRTSMDWRGLGWWRPLVGLAVYAAFAHLHGWLIGVSVFPG